MDITGALGTDLQVLAILSRVMDPNIRINRSFNKREIMMAIHVFKQFWDIPE